MRHKHGWLMLVLAAVGGYLLVTQTGLFRGPQKIRRQLPPAQIGPFDFQQDQNPDIPNPI